MSSSKAKATGKLATLGTFGQVSEGELNKANDIGIFPVNPVPAHKVNGLIDNYSTQFVLDTGAAVTFLRKDLWDIHVVKPEDAKLEEWNGRRLVGVEGTSLDVYGVVNVQIVPKVVVVGGLTADVILGMDFLEANNCTIDLGQKILYLGDCEAPLPMNGSRLFMPTVGVTLQETLQSAYSEIEIMANLGQSGLQGLCMDCRR